MRASSYIIYVDLPDRSEEMLLVHGYTGAFDKVSRPVAAFVRSLELRRAPRPLYGAWVSEPVLDGPVERPSEETLRILQRRGYITEMDYAMEEEALKNIALTLHQISARRISYIFMPTYDCNLRCSYCFQNHMRTDPRFRHLLSSMTINMVERILQALVKIEAGHVTDTTDSIHRNVGFFGGEPLLAMNRPVVDYTIQKFREMGTANFWAVSNGTELEAYADILSPDRLSRIQITLDGPPSEHDARRIYADGSPSFEKIARNIQTALDRGVRIDIRMNIDRRNIAQLPELAEIVHRYGWDRYPNFGVYTAPIRVANENVAQAEVLDSWELDNAVAAMQREYSAMSMIAPPDEGIKQQARRIFSGAERDLPLLRESFCSAHTGMYIFDSFGDIYACWERTGDPSVRIGCIKEDGTLQLNGPVLQTWRSRTVASNPVCSRCRYALHCGGGCAVLAQRKTGELHMNYCDGFSSRFRANVAEAYLDHVAGLAMAKGSDRVCDQ